MLRRKGLLDKFIETNWRFALTPPGKNKLNTYDRIFKKYKTSGPTVTKDETDEEGEAGTKFALEEQLRDYLAENLTILEPKLSLWPVEEEGDAVEFQVDDQGPSRRIDILAKDRDGLPVVPARSTRRSVCNESDRRPTKYRTTLKTSQRSRSLHPRPPGRYLQTPGNARQVTLSTDTTRGSGDFALSTAIEPYADALKETTE